MLLSYHFVWEIGGYLWEECYHNYDKDHDNEKWERGFEDIADILS